MANCEKIVLGLDIGIASCGVGIIDSQTDKVISATSCIFPSAEAAENQLRRGLRQTKRLKRRQATRIEDFTKLWTGKGFCESKEPSTDLVDLRVKALSNKIELSELYNVLRTELKHRGISYLDDLDEEIKGSNDYARGLKINQLEMQDRHPCQIQAERLKKYGSYRGQNTVEIDGERVVFSNIFTTSAYRKEVEQILNTQKQYHPSLDEQFIEDYLAIFNRKRAYYVGPGNELSRTDYGRYTTKKNSDGSYITDDNIFEKLIGKCSVYPDEFRASGASYTAQEFNFLNDMNNLTVGGRKLEENEKREIANAFFESDKLGTSNIEKIIASITKIPASEIKGARVDKDNKHLYHSFECFRKMTKFFSENGKDIHCFDRDTLDKIAHVLTINSDRDSILEGFNTSELVFDERTTELLIDFRKKESSLFGKWQSFSLKLMKDLIPTMWEEPVEQMTLLDGLGLMKSKRESFKGLTYIPAGMITEEIFNPVVRRSVNVAIKAVNKVIQRYGYPEQIVIEMPRDKNEEDQKARITKMQGKDEKELAAIIDKIKNEFGIEIKESHFRNHKKLALKLKLWNEQNGVCLYSGKPISIVDLLNTPTMFEIDHAIPLSVSLNDSRSNKVLVYRVENQDKGNRTPYQYLTNRTGDWGWKEYKASVLEMKKRKHIVDSKSANITDKKAENLLFIEDITKIDVVRGFISRNLNDTRYASRTVLNTLQAFFDANCTGTKVKVIRGSFTNSMRANFHLPKDREESYAHHAVDACLIAYSQMRYDAYKKIQDGFIDFETGEILDQNAYEKNMSDEVYEDLMYGKRWAAIRAGITEAENTVKFWHRVDSKPNRALCDQTIYGTREIDGKVVQISKTADIRTKSGYDAFLKHKDELLCKKHDYQTYKKLLLICEQYSGETNPFVAYEKDGNIVTKYSKKNNGPKIGCLKFENGAVNSCIDVSHKYGFEKGSKKVILGSLKPFRTDVYQDIQTGKYYLIGLKYSDIKSQGDAFTIDEEAYTRILQSEKEITKILAPGETRKDLPTHNIVYKFSLYKNDIIQYEKDGNLYTERFLSRTIPTKPNYIETKPIDKENFKKRNIVGLSKCTKLSKIRSDILGNYYFCNQEKWQDIF